MLSSPYNLHAMELFHSSDFQSHVDDLMVEHHVPGLAIAIVQNETTASAGYGKSSLQPPKTCTADTLFDIASASKSLTAASVALLVNDEKYPEVQWEATMSSLLPGEFEIPGVTVEDILSHRSGMPSSSYDDSYLGVRAAKPDTAQSVTRNLRHLTCSAPIRSKYMYCNMMYTVATYLVEKKTGLSFSDFLEHHFFQPLDMRSSSLQPERARSKGLGDRIATGYNWKEDIKEYGDGFQTPDCPEAQGAGSIITSVNDYIKWVKVVMDHQDPITDNVYKGLLKQRISQNPDAEDLRPLTSPTMYGAGWEIFYYRGHQVVSHDGLVQGFGSTHFFLPDFKFGGAIFGNSDAAGEIALILMRELIDEVLKVPHSERPDWTKIESDLYPENNDNNIDDKIAKLRQKMCPGIQESEPQKMPLCNYTGEYWNPGYHGMTVQIKDDKLFINAADRSFGFTVRFDHVCQQSKYIAHLSGVLDGGDEPLKAEFIFNNNRVVRMGLYLEDELEDLIWFDKVEEHSD
ncbi:hypothetical protein N7510_003695 [Penicillium lagena]|uniref:uncharacterized protein n=1 Tax=Penicillium lagena TaxID=94218 RepID=UPI002541914E|nr:uncharacterized protein N7510_003695 [Penicillium lagena]KAJ5619711.1 hypothetical protein N7510_003695 [Penicillium lagena]